MKRLGVVVLVYFVFVGFSTLSAHGNDEEWVPFFTNLAGDRFYYNQQSVVYGQNKTVRVVQKVTSGRADSNQEVGTALEFDCSKLMFRRLKTATLSRSGETRSATDSSQWNSIQTGSPMEILSQEVCVKTKLRGRWDR